jgi:hypothetical protein
MGMRGQLQAPTALFLRRQLPVRTAQNVPPKPVRSFGEQTNLLILLGTEQRLVASTGRTQYSDHAVGYKNELRYIKDY